MLARLAIIDIFNRIPNQSNVTAIEIILENKIIIYKMPKNRQKLTGLIKKFKDIWIDKSQIIKIPKKDWIIIPLINNYENKYKTNKVCIYTLP